MSGLMKNFKQPNNSLNATLTHPAVKLVNVNANGFTCADVAPMAHDYGGFIRKKVGIEFVLHCCFS